MTFTRPLNRVTPAIPAAQMQTHAIIAPLESHWRKATCAEVECGAFLNGWSLDTTGLPEELVHLAKNSGRRFTATTGTSGELLVFEAGQQCFKSGTHRTRVDREEIFLKLDGDWRGNPRGTDPVVFSSPDAFVDHLHTHLDQFGG